MALALGVAASAMSGLVTSWTASDADQFLVCCFRRQESDPLSLEFLHRFDKCLRETGGAKIQLRSDKPRDWEVIDGRDNHREPNHLSPAIFDFNSVMVAAFPTSDDVHTWWNSDEVFTLLKNRGSIEKLGIFMVEGLQKAFDIKDRNKIAFGEKFILFEFIRIQAFKPMQQYVDNYKRFSEKAASEIGVDCNLLFAECLSGVLACDFPLEAVCASTWRMKSDAHTWYDSDIYQNHLSPLRREYALSLTVLVPICEEATPWELKKQEKQLATLAKMLNQ